MNISFFKKTIFAILCIAFPTFMIAQNNNNTGLQEASADFGIARVESYNGIFVFTDCTPIAEYEVLGEVTNAIPDSHNEGLSFFDFPSPPNHIDIRRQLITNALYANRQVEGIIITLSKIGEGHATLIKFKDGVKDKSLAKVNSFYGVLVFTDCTPINNYSFLKKYETGNISYADSRNKIIQKACKKNPEVQGVIFHIEQYKYNIEAIKF